MAIAELEEATEAGDLVRLKTAIALHGAAAEETDALEGLLTNGPRDAELVLPALRLPCPCDY